VSAAAPEGAPPPPPHERPRHASVLEVFGAFLQIGLTAFGGPIAHFALFRREFVDRRAWVTERQFGQLLTLSQFLPGPGSSKLGFSIALMRGGWLGALAGFLAFTLPSALLLFAFAAFMPYLAGPVGQAVLHGLKLVALSVVSFGLYGMVRGLCPDTPRRLLAICAALLVLLDKQSSAQIWAVLLGAAGGALLCRDVHPDFSGELRVRYGRGTGLAFLGAYLLLLVGLPWAAHLSGRDGVQYAEAFFRTGALAFGGGHVVLPLLQDTVVAPGWVSRADFMAGYGAAQAVPGPMFSLSAYLGARLPGPDGGWIGACVALVATFLPGFLLVLGMLPFWSRFAAHPRAARAIAGVSAAVVGLLGATLYDPVWLTAVRAPSDVLIAACAVFALLRWNVSALAVVGFCVAASVLRSYLPGGLSG
jgi:chromate transporter